MHGQQNIKKYNLKTGVALFPETSRILRTPQ